MITEQPERTIELVWGRVTSGPIRWARFCCSQFDRRARFDYFKESGVFLCVCVCDGEQLQADRRSHRSSCSNAPRDSQLRACSLYKYKHTPGGASIVSSTIVVSSPWRPLQNLRDWSLSSFASCHFYTKRNNNNNNNNCVSEIRSKIRTPFTTTLWSPPSPSPLSHIKTPSAVIKQAWLAWQASFWSTCMNLWPTRWTNRQNSSQY